MSRFLAAAVIASLTIMFAVAALFLQPSDSTAQGPVQLGADADPIGNSETSVGTYDGCISVNTGDEFPFDIVISDVDKLVHWELYLKFDPSIIEVVDRDMHMFLDVNSYSSVKTEWASYADGREFLGAADLRDAPESGSGVLARLTLQALGPGLSTANIFSKDVDDDRDDDYGPRLTDADGNPVGDVTDDGIFDGPTHHAVIAVDQSCDAATPTPTLPPSPTPPSGGGTAPPDTSPSPDVLAVAGDPTFEPTADDDSASENDQDSALAGGSEDASEAGAGEEDNARADTDSAAEIEATSVAVVRAADGTSGSSDPGDNSGPAAGGNSSPSSSSGGGLPLWIIACIAAAILVAAAATSAYLASRKGDRFGRW